MLRWIGWAALALGILVATGLAAAFVFLAPPERPFDAPTGPFRVGVREADMVDRSRSDPFTRRTDDPRRFTVSIWYPTSSVGKAAAYIQRPGELADPLQAILGARVKTNAILNAPLAAAPKPFPVVIYNHGFGANRQNGVFLAEHLASHGYVVVSAEHFTPGGATARFMDGTAFRPDENLPPVQTGDVVADTRRFEAYLTRLVHIWSLDTRFLISSLSRGDLGFLHGRIDVDRIAVVGTSLGGATALETAAEDRRIRATVNLDGSLFGRVIETGVPSPSLMLRHDYADDLKTAPAQYARLVKASLDRQLANIAQAQARSAARFSVTVIPGSTHLDYSDYPLLYRSKRNPDQPSTHSVQVQIKAETLAFLDATLKDRKGVSGPGAAKLW